MTTATAPRSWALQLGRPTSRPSWFTSDWHFGHRNILTLGHGRPFATVEEHDDTLIARHNELVGHDDQVWVLGDVAMGDIAASLDCCTRMNGHKILVCGNHDRPSLHRDVQSRRDVWIDRYKQDGGFEFVIPFDHFGGILQDGRKINVSHYPYAGEADPNRPDRFADRRPNDDGRWLLHGHVHDAWRIRQRQINVGVDVWDFYPVAETDLITIIDGAES